MAVNMRRLDIRDSKPEDLAFILQCYGEMPQVKKSGLDAFGHYLQQSYQQPLEARDCYYLILELDSQPIGFSFINRIMPNDKASFHFYTRALSFRDRGIANGYDGVLRCLKHFQLLYQLKRCDFYIRPENRMAINGAKRFFIKNSIHYQQHSVQLPERLIQPASDMVVFEFQLTFLI